MRKRRWHFVGYSFASLAAYYFIYSRLSKQVA